MQEISIDLPDGSTIQASAGTAVGTLHGADGTLDGLPFLAAIVNNDVASLSYPISINSEVRFLTMADPDGWRIYRRSLTFLAAKAVDELYPDARFSVEHSLGGGLYCSFRRDGQDGITTDQIEALASRMREYVEKDLPIERRKISYRDALNEFEEAGQHDKLKLLKYRNPPHVVVYECGGFSDLAHRPIAPRTGLLNMFELIHYPPGFVLHIPDRDEPGRMSPFRDQPHLFQIYQEHKEWGRILGVNTVGRLNEIIANNEHEAFIRTAEALHEKKLGNIADAIQGARERIKLILIAGPSSAGKTTFAKRLTTHLTVYGIRPVTISTDDYFLGADDNPVDENGEPDFEHLEAVDLALFNQDLSRLIEGETVDIPSFNFNTKQREYRNHSLCLENDQILIIEGIHGLNPRLTEMVDNQRKYRIYVSALTQLNIDANNRVSTTDNRLMRRMVRDNRYRGHSALETFRLWPSVRRGEKRWVFPYQREADATFNSALDYELAVLRPKVEPLLLQIKPTDGAYSEARRLSEFLLNFLAIDDRPVPRTSILREYIGGSAFKY